MLQFEQDKIKNILKIVGSPVGDAPFQPANRRRRKFWRMEVFWPLLTKNFAQNSVSIGSVGVKNDFVV
ncbi:MAG: hypothetical protein A3H57_00835 [Candidatus Taylorbacteria bacterium RIFCSPLOWO2_02_FULL_43_11]|uniref:Uncharacterized protein n=1 Tax=Candidatus Taylorbacteria bacterium RIFCSPHIGHO2_02_FULL_43_32b TaxID=1802306 RepID=A0A1G2ML82_9BACT|nr:MAG: hypothetical protein A2743_03510 [Candidatus Taylorbacteria bacterium RIFCSPHIGHO2_01_FULL_43_47]OHA24504.1 MAG: hypothetical protein A3C72_00960 [Candidatus Taylorbacteria bacterium RIFCSPHIGHO2_02_FULL_43_32b]OHA31818.1 MAG: hypothetical protein A3B08_01255 [Candidatus Taylorbacteria bacterium RIFCSPLOWO2_01_FULL_43_44]OHA36698.1 MAG: hypothetical protein A3H57_00835 [Candidatus Taylorbacteria bacterium RIFCSPLOWO2_02_FULL_43_11]